MTQTNIVLLQWFCHLFARANKGNIWEEEEEREEQSVKL